MSGIVQRRTFISIPLLLGSAAVIVGGGYMLYRQFGGASQPGGEDVAGSSLTAVPSVSWTAPPSEPPAPAPAPLPAFTLPEGPPPEPPKVVAAQAGYRVLANNFIEDSGGPDQPPEPPARLSRASRDNIPQPIGQGIARQGNGQMRESMLVSDLSRTIKPTDYIFCVMHTAMDTTHPGHATCGASRPVLSWDRTTELIPKDTPIDIDYQPLNMGQGRVVAISGMAERSDGVRIPLGAPITDAQGRIGIDGQVDNSRMWKGIGTALLVDAGQALINLPQTALMGQHGGNTFLNLNLQNTQNAMQQTLGQLVNQPPILFKNVGEEIAIRITEPVHVGQIRYEVAR